ncbi:MAG: hypothetical protein Q8N47_14410 [Bryobacterales bacterium]|nr:hypothetical protein [Bryobacterales bacterium]
MLEAVLPDIATAVESGATKRLQTCHGLLSDLGPAPSSDDIDEIRKEMFSDFPRADAGPALDCT